jgi:hypothetical protein
MVYDIVNESPLVRQWTIRASDENDENANLLKALYQLYVDMAVN